MRKMSGGTQFFSFSRLSGSLEQANELPSNEFLPVMAKPFVVNTMPNLSNKTCAVVKIGGL